MWYFAAAAEESILKDDEIYSNDIYAILQTYGVEMAREAILREMRGVFGAYNIVVDRRHLELIADYMVSWSLLFMVIVLTWARLLTVDTSLSTGVV